MTAAKRDIGHYEDAELIGLGGFGAVYRAADAAHGREVAIKVLQGSLGEAERRRFDRERRAMGNLSNHPNIIAVYESGYTEAGEGYIVMELADGGSLKQLLETRGPLPWSEAATMMAAVAAAVQVAHDNGVVHRDIKPDNILIDQFGHPKLTDFGIAAVANNATATTSTTMTLAHAAPEVLKGASSTEAVDIYALGSTFHTLVSGLPPFMRAEDESVAPMLNRAMTEPPPDLRADGVPDRLAAVIERSLAKAPEHRQSSAMELSNGLLSTKGEVDPGATGVVGGTMPAGPPSVSPNQGTPYAETAQQSPGMAGDPGLGPQAQPSSSAVGGADPDWAPAASPSLQPRLAGQEERSSATRAIWAAVAVLTAIVIGLGVMIQRQLDADDLGEEASPQPTAPATVAPTTAAPETAAPPQTDAPTDPTSSSAAPATVSSNPVSSTTPPVEQRLVGVTAASSSAQSGQDACGALVTFGPDNVMDDARTTAWRVSGDGQGAWIEVDLGGLVRIAEVGLVPGYAKLDTCDGTNRFFENRRVQEVRWIIGGQTINQQFDPDLPEMQEIRLAQPIEADGLRVEIVSTTTSGGRDFTAVSDLRIIGG